MIPAPKAAARNPEGIDNPADAPDAAELPLAVAAAAVPDAEPEWEVVAAAVVMMTLDEEEVG